MTRGDGGQNLVGSEQGELLGLIRTQELLAARRIDGAEQFFTWPIEFGFSKTAAETFEKWGHQAILSDVVWTIRRFRPDVTVTTVAGVRVICYEGIPPQTIFPPYTAKLVRADVRTLTRKIGCVMGVGDEVPRALQQLGCEVTFLGADELARGDLSRFDAIVTGVRAYNVRQDLAVNQQRVLDYVQSGGTWSCST